MTAAEVLRAHQHRRVRWACACGFETYDGDLDRRLDALARHQAEMLAAAGLLGHDLATCWSRAAEDAAARRFVLRTTSMAEHDREVAAFAVRSAADEVDAAGAPGWVHDGLTDRANRIAAGEVP